MQESHPKGVGRRTTSASFSSSKSFKNASSRGNVIHIQNSAVRKSKKCSFGFPGSAYQEEAGTKLSKPIHNICCSNFLCLHSRRWQKYGSEPCGPSLEDALQMDQMVIISLIYPGSWFNWQLRLKPSSDTK